jgi:flavin-dependent dehydrogenase
MSSLEVAIIGAGPAGSAAARLLASWGHRVALLHRSADSERPALAESIPPSCRKLFAAIGVLDAIDGAGFYRSTGNTVWWGSHDVRREGFPDGQPGYQVDRTKFDALLRERAREAGADLQHFLATGTEASGDGGASIVSSDTRTVEARFVLDCSGRSGVVARRRWRMDVPGHPRTVGLTGIWSDTSVPPDVDPSHTLVESYGDGWAWSVPISRNVRHVTAMVDPQRTELARGRSPLDVYRTELRKAPHLAATLTGGSLVRGPWGCDASVYAARTYAQAPFLLVGDAASFVDPLSSYGVKKALASAWLAAIAVHTAIRKPSMTTSALAFFAAREAEMCAALLEQTRAHFGSAAAVHGHPFWADRADGIDLPSPLEPDVRTLRDDARVQRAFAAMKAQPRLVLRQGTDLRIEPRPMVRDHEIVLEDRLFTPSCPAGMRYLRDVDVSGVLSVVQAHEQVPELFEAYNRRFPPVPLPDFLGALAVMLAFGLVEDAAASAG